MKYEIKTAKKFKRGLKLAAKQGLDVNELRTVVDTLAAGEKLPEKYVDHELKGNRKDERECHINSDWLLVYQYIKSDLVLYLLELGTHSKLFKK